MKKIIIFILGLMMCFTLSSCVTTAQAQVDDMYDDVDISVVVIYGTPYYNAEGLLLYYIYRDMFYYPYYYNNRYYFHRYSRPLPPHIYRDRYRPIPRGNFRHHGQPNINHNPRPNNGVKPNGNGHKPNVTRPNTNINRGGNRPTIGGNHRPMTQPRSSTRMSSGGDRQFGHRR